MVKQLTMGGQPGPEDGDERREFRRFPFLLIYLGIFAIFTVWAALGTMGVVSFANGEVVPASQVKTVQHLEGGIVRKILVKEGDEVKAGEPIIEMESTASGADVIELKARITSLMIEIARLKAETTNAKKFDLPADLMTENKGLVAQGLALFESRSKGLADQINVQEQIIAQRQQDIQEINARTRNREQTLKFLDEQIDIGQKLLLKQLTNRYKHLDLLKEKSRLVSSIDEDLAVLKRAQSARREASGRLASIRSTYMSEALRDLDAAQRQLDEFSPRLAKFEDSLQRTVINSPVAGLVKTLYVVTIGGVIAPGGAVVDIVPIGDRLVVEAKLPPQDIGFVRPGQSAKISLASADAARFDNITGIVDSVSPDTILTPEGTPFYRVRIETSRDHFARGDLRYDLFPGMQVVAYIETGKRTILEYLIEPFIRSSDIAMRER